MYLNCNELLIATIATARGYKWNIIEVNSQIDRFIKNYKNSIL